MKTFRIFGVQLEIPFFIKRIKRVYFKVSSSAYDISIESNSTPYPILQYWKDGKMYSIELPKCRKAKLISKTEFNKEDTIVDLYL